MSLKDDCRLREVLDRTGLDLVAVKGACSVEEVELYLEPCGRYALEGKGDGFGTLARDEGGLCLR